MSGLAAGLVLVPVAVPLASAQTEPLPPAAAACGSLGPPLCGLIDQFENALAPLEPLFALGLPVLSELGNSLHQLQSTLEQVAAGGPLDGLQDAVGQLGGILSVVGGVTKPLLAPLDAAGLGGLLSVLGNLQSALDAQLAAGPSVAAAASTPVNLPGSVVVPSTSKGAGSSTFPSIPAVPEGEVLELPDLALPDFGATVADAVELASAATPARSAVDRPDPDTTNDAGTAAAAVAVGGVLLTAGLLTSRTRAARRTTTY